MAETAERDAAAAYAAAVRIGRGTEGDAPLVPQRAVLGIIDEVRAAMPEAAITTDIIVGFPGETEADFQATLDVVAAARFAAAFTFQYSIRPGTPAATMPDQVPKAVVQERYERLVDAGRARSPGRRTVSTGPTVEVMFADGEGRKDMRPSDVRPGTRQPTGACRGPRGAQRSAAAWRPCRGDHYLRRAAPPHRRRRPAWRSGAPAAATRGKRAGRYPRLVRRRSVSACRPSAHLISCSPRKPV